MMYKLMNAMNLNVIIFVFFFLCFIAHAATDIVGCSTMPVPGFTGLLPGDFFSP